MTTIAYRDGELAADSQSTSCSVATGSITKIARREDGTLCGATGDAAFNYAFCQWVLNGEQGEQPKITTDGDGDPTSGGFIVRPDGSVWFYELNGSFPMTGDYFAWGSGREFAMGAMFLGASPTSAVAAAVKHDTGTGGKINVLRREA